MTSLSLLAGRTEVPLLFQKNAKYVAFALEKALLFSLSRLCCLRPNVTLCVDLYSGQILVFYDLDDGVCFVICVIRFWT